jgi:hypothetical protein
MSEDEERVAVLVSRLTQITMELSENEGRLNVYNEQISEIKMSKDCLFKLPLRTISDLLIRKASLFRRQADIIDELRETKEYKNL